MQSQIFVRHCIAGRLLELHDRSVDRQHASTRKRNQLPKKIILKMLLENSPINVTYGPSLLMYVPIQCLRNKRPPQDDARFIAIRPPHPQNNVVWQRLQLRTKRAFI